MSKNNFNQSNKLGKMSYQEIYLAHSKTIRKDPFLRLGLAELTIPPPKKRSFGNQCHKSASIRNDEIQSSRDRFNWKAND